MSSAVSNVRWVGISQGGRLVLQIGGLAILSRLLTPDVFGLVAMAAVVVNFANLLRDLGTAAAVIQRKELVPATIAAAYWFSVSCGVIIGLAIVLLAPLFAASFHRADLAPLLRVLALSFPLASLGTVHQALLERESKFSKVASIEMVSSSTGLLVAVVAAKLGAGAYSIALQTVTTALMSTVQFANASPWRPHRSVDIASELKSIWRFSSGLVGFNLINYCSRNADSWIIGRSLGAAALGPYSLAYRLMLFPVQNFSYVANRALFPIYSRRQDSIDEVRELYLRTLSLIASVTAPLMAGAMALRYPFVDVVLGPKWTMAAALLAWLSPVGFAQSLSSCGGAIYMARGRTDLMMYIGVTSSVIVVGSFFVGVHWGVLGVARAYFAANVITILPAFYITMRVLGGNFMQLLVRVWRPIALAAAMGILLAMFDAWAQSAGWPEWLRLGAGTVLGAGLYGAVALRFNRHMLADVRSLLGNRGAA